MEDLAPFYRAQRRAKETYQRRMLVLDDAKLAINIARQLPSGLHMGWDPIKELSHLKFVSIADSDEVLGKTFDNLFLDLRGSFTANDLGKVISTVRGGGLIVLLVPKFENWINANLSYHEKLAIPPYSLEDVHHNFIPRLIRKFYEHEGIWIYRSGRWEKESIEDEIKVIKPKKPKKPKKTNIAEEIYRMAASQDQVDVIKALEDQEEFEPIVVIADRGRGKSASLGLGIAGLRTIWPSKLEVVITAPKKKNLEVLLEFLERGLKAIDVPYSWKNESLLIGKKIKVMVVDIQEALKKHADLFVIDEAAGIPLPILKRFVKEKKRVVFSTTVHGYEGSGRTFSIRFMDFLRAHGKHRVIRMEQPIRYNAVDPIERWLFDTLLLDAEPDEPPKEIKELITVFPEKEKLFRDEKLLRNYFGLLVIAHYKNTPNDLMTIADAPHHFPAITMANGKVVNSIQYAFEGGLSREQVEELYNDPKAEGNLIPDIFAKHYKLFEVGMAKGIRIVRIVTHPFVWARGIGSFALRSLELKHKDEISWIGASFGAAPKLVKFWIKNGYLPISMSPSRNAVSGEYSLVVVKPVGKALRDTIEKASKEFTKRFIESLSDIYWDLEIEVAWEILKGCLPVEQSFTFSELELTRLMHFIQGRHIYEIDVDIITKVAKWYFYTKQSFLNEEEEKVLIAKVLQRQSWKVIKEHMEVERIYEVLREAMRKAMEVIEKKNLTS